MFVIKRNRRLEAGICIKFEMKYKRRKEFLIMRSHYTSKQFLFNITTLAFEVCLIIMICSNNNRLVLRSIDFLRKPRDFVQTFFLPDEMATH